MAKIKLEEDEVQYLIDFVKKGQKSARELTRARILLLANKNKNGSSMFPVGWKYLHSYNVAKQKRETLSLNLIFNGKYL